MGPSKVREKKHNRQNFLFKKRKTEGSTRQCNWRSDGKKKKKAKRFWIPTERTKGVYPDERSGQAHKIICGKGRKKVPDWGKSMGFGVGVTKLVSAI